MEEWKVEVLGEIPPQQENVEALGEIPLQWLKIGLPNYANTVAFNNE